VAPSDSVWPFTDDWVRVCKFTRLSPRTQKTEPTTYMFTGFQPMQPTETELASQALAEESSYRFPYFSANDAVTLGLSLRKRFRASTRYSKGKGLVITVQTIAGHTLFSCTVGDLGGVSGVGDVSLDSWSVLEGMVNVVKRTGHSSYYVEKGMSAMAKGQGSVQTDLRVYGGGECLHPSVSTFPLFTRPGRQHFRSGWRCASGPPSSTYGCLLFNSRTHCAVPSPLSRVILVRAGTIITYA